MSAFSTEIEQLRTAAAAMRAAEKPATATAAVTVPDVSVTGDADLTSALSSFSSAWRTGSSALTTDVERSAVSLGTTALTYAETDLNVAAVMRALGKRP